ncbi:MAG: hypothetical protein HC836_10700 [Richelia sp. RM2_1_2]|nr:hypothetical protein [Richelia sp. RM2_1_2]
MTQIYYINIDATDIILWFIETFPNTSAKFTIINVNGATINNQYAVLLKIPDDLESSLFSLAWVSNSVQDITHNKPVIALLKSSGIWEHKEYSLHDLVRSL